MKNSTLKLFCVTLLAGAFPLATIAIPPSDDAQIKSFKKALTSVPAPEMAAKAASLVSQAKIDERKAAAIAAVRATLEVNPSSSIPVVGAIARIVPEAAAEAAATAASALPKSAAAIAKAAAVAAPDYADKIVYAVCKEVPKEYAAVTVAVSQAVPGASKKILSALIEAVPPLKVFVDRASAELAVLFKDRANGPTVAAVVDGANVLLDKAANNLRVPKEDILAQRLTSDQMARMPQALPPEAAPILGPPFVSRTGVTQTEVTGTVPTTGPRNYSNPSSP
jgi:hypothetical protein